MAEMTNAKRSRILDAATKVFAENGYQYATISEIAREARISTGLVYSYFTNKLDLLLSVILLFVKKLNDLNEKKLSSVEGPRAELDVVLGNFEALLIDDENALHMVKVSNEALPHLVMIKDKELQEKRQDIVAQYNHLFRTIDEIIASGQTSGVFDDVLSASLMRQALFGVIERVVHGLFVTNLGGESMGYDAKEAQGAIRLMVEKFIVKQVG